MVRGRFARLCGYVVGVALLVGACGGPPPPTLPRAPVSTGSQPSTGPLPSAHPPASGRYTKIMVIVEENHGYNQVIGSPQAPYINTLATTYGSATNMFAGYPAACPSLAAYVLMTSGSTQGICDDRNPSAHPLSVPNVFAQAASAGGWRAYAEDSPGGCVTGNSDNLRFVVRHVPPAYYTSEAGRCAQWIVPLGTPDAGALHDDLAAGKLPALSFVTPDTCADMHGSPDCPTDLVGAGDSWLRSWMPRVLASPDYTQGRLVVVITWDEGTPSDNHIPTIVISPSTSHVLSGVGFTHCATLRLTEEILGVPPLGCAATAASMATAFHLPGNS